MKKTDVSLTKTQMLCACYATFLPNFDKTASMKLVPKQGKGNKVGHESNSVASLTPMELWFLLPQSVHPALVFWLVMVIDIRGHPGRSLVWTSRNEAFTIPHCKPTIGGRRDTYTAAVIHDFTTT